MVDPRSAVGIRLASATAPVDPVAQEALGSYCPRFSVPFVWNCRPEHPHNPAVLLPRPQSRRRRGRPPPLRPTPTLKTETQTLLHGNEDLVRKQAGTNREDSVLRAVDGNRPNNISGDAGTVVQRRQRVDGIWSDDKRIGSINGDTKRIPTSDFKYSPAELRTNKSSCLRIRRTVLTGIQANEVGPTSASAPAGPAQRQRPHPGPPVTPTRWCPGACSCSRAPPG